MAVNTPTNIWSVHGLGGTEYAYVDADGDFWISTDLHLAGILNVTGASNFTGAAIFSSTVQIVGAMNFDNAIDHDHALTAAGAAMDTGLTINHATANADGHNVLTTQLTTARSGGIVSGVRGNVTSLAGDSGGLYCAFKASLTDGGGSAVHSALYVETGHDWSLDLSAVATGDALIRLGANLAQASGFADSTGNLMLFDTQTGAKAITIPTGTAFSATDAIVAPSIPDGNVIADPGDGNAIAVTSSGSCALTSGTGGETRTMAAPTRIGQEIGLSCTVDGGGDIGVTVAAAFNAAGNTVWTSGDAGDAALFRAFTVAGALVWKIVLNDGGTLS